MKDAQYGTCTCFVPRNRSKLRQELSASCDYELKLATDGDEIATNHNQFKLGRSIDEQTQDLTFLHFWFSRACEAPSQYANQTDRGGKRMRYIGRA